MDFNTHTFNIVRDHLVNAWDLSMESEDNPYHRDPGQYPLSVDLVSTTPYGGGAIIVVRLGGVTSFRGASPDLESMAFRLYAVKDDEIERLTPAGDPFDLGPMMPWPEEDV